MSISSKLRDTFNRFSQDEVLRITRMAWEDRNGFESIRHQFELSPNQIVQFMRYHHPRTYFERWRKRANQRGHLKQAKKRGFTEGRFKCTRQRLDGSTKGWK